jgi:glutathione S-transferase
VLDEHLIGPRKSYLCGDTVTIADHCGASLLTVGEIIGCDFSASPNIDRWLRNVKALPTWHQWSHGFEGRVASCKGKAF